MKTRRWFNRNRSFSFARIATVGTLISAAAAMALFAASGFESTSRFEMVPDGGIVQTSFVPRGVSAESRIVVVQLKDKSVAEAQADAGRKVTKAEKDQIKAQLKATQDGLKPHISSAGGKVLAQFQSALNGIKVQIPASKLSQLRSLPGVTALLPVHEDVPDNVTSVPYIGAPTVWDAPTNFRGEGIKIGVIDSGIDYTHANFGGPGTVAAFTAANATDTLPADPAQFGPAAPKVKGGFDFVGDAYNANDPNHNTPMPDPNPLDCFGHGSHVAGTAAGFGVTSGGATYSGPYNPGIYTAGAFRIGPGVAPKADIYAYRVFGCAGSTNVTVDAINRAFDDDVDVINMSLGSPFGTADDASAVASTNVTKAGVIVVASSGNNGANQYITGSPATGTGAINVAANDANTGFPAATMAISSPANSIVAQNSNGASFTDGTNLQVAVLRTSYPNGPVSLGCTDADYDNYPGGVAGKLVVTLRGTCSRVGRAIRAEQHGAAAAAMLNTDTGYPPFEGQITSDPDNGFQFTVTIPFFGIRGVLATATSDSSKLAAADTSNPPTPGGTVTLTNTTLINPGFTSFASFSSSGPRTGDSSLKPDITAPGVSTFSTLVGSGNGATAMSGTSMAAPHVAGVAALVKQAHPTWNEVQEWKAAIVNTGNPSAIGGLSPYRTSRGGTGLVQPVLAVKTNVIALSVLRNKQGDNPQANTGESTLNFGFSELNANFSDSRTIKLRNKGSSPATFNISQTNAAGRPHSIGLGSSSVTIPGGGQVLVNVTLNVPVATVGDSNASGLSFREVAGLITFTPSGGSNNGVTLRVPYYLVPRALSGVNATMAKTVTTGSPTTNANLSNPSGPIAGNADFYAWGLNDPKESDGSGDIRAIGAQSFDCAATFDAPTCAAFAADRFIVFAVNNHNRWSNAATNEFDIYVDVNPAANDGDDYIIVGVDQGAVQAAQFNGRLAAFVFSTRSAGASLVFLATAPTDSSTALLPIFNSQLCRTGEPCLSAVNPRLTYHAFGFDVTGPFVDVVPGPAKYNAYSSSISQGMFATVPVGASGTVPVSINPTEWAQTPALGTMIVTLDNSAGKGEAALLPLALKP